jgi:hypothetical protein
MKKIKDIILKYSDKISHFVVGMSVASIPILLFGATPLWLLVALLSSILVGVSKEIFDMKISNVKKTKFDKLDCGFTIAGGMIEIFIAAVGLTI